MKFSEQKIGALDNYTHVVVSDNKEFWMGLTMEPFGVFVLRYGHMGNYVQFLMEVSLGRQKNKADAIYRKLVERLYFIAEHNEKSIHLLLPDVRNANDNVRFLAEVEVLAQKIKQQQAKSNKHKKHEPDFTEVKYIAKVVEEHSSENGVVSEVEIIGSGTPETPFGDPEDIEDIPAHVSLAKQLEWEPQIEAPIPSFEPDRVPEPTRPIVMPFDDWTKLNNSMRPVILVDHVELDYDLLIIVTTLERPRLITNARGNKPKTGKYLVKLGKYFKTRPHIARSLEFVLPTTAPFEGGESPFLLFNSEYHQKQYPEETTTWPKQNGYAKWSFEAYEMARRILQAANVRVSDKVVGARTRVKMDLVPVKAEEEASGEVKNLGPMIFRIANVRPVYSPSGKFEDEEGEED